MKSSRVLTLLILTVLAVTPYASDADGSCRNGQAASSSTPKENVMDEVAAMQLHLRTDAGKASEACDWKCYMERYAGIANVCKKAPAPSQCAKKHYESHGKSEGRDCTCAVYSEKGKCDWNCYMQRYAGIGNVCKKDLSPSQCARKHWESHGKSEGRDCTCGEDKYEGPCDWDCYMANYAGIAKACNHDKKCAEKHYNSHGKSEGRDCTCKNPTTAPTPAPTPTPSSGGGGGDAACGYEGECNWQCYMDQYPDISRACQNNCLCAKGHWDNYGQAEGRFCGCVDDADRDGLCDWDCYMFRYSGVAMACNNDASCAHDHYAMYGKKEGRDCTCPPAEQQNEVFDGYHIMIAGGVSLGRKYLSAEITKDTDLWYTDDGSGRQLWIIGNCTADDCTNGEKNIKVFAGFDFGIFNALDFTADKVFLSVNPYTDNVGLWHEDDGSGRQRWLIEPCQDSGCGPDEVHIKVAGGTHKGLTDWGLPIYLSSSKHGIQIDCHWEDDGSGRQRWKIEGVRGAYQDSIQRSVALIAEAVYDFPFIGKNVDGWTLPKYFEEHDGLFGTDKLGIYERNGECALAVSGSDDVKDWVQDMVIIPYDDCGVTFHQGFRNSADKLVKASWWSEAKSYFTSSSCNGGRYFVGHGLGGAIVSIMAGCNAHWSELQGIQLDGLFTFGAPGVARQVVTNNGDVIPGLRFYNEDLLGGDPIPSKTYLLGLKHPKMTAVRFRSVLGKTKIVCPGDDYGCAEVPDGKIAVASAAAIAAATAAGAAAGGPAGAAAAGIAAAAAAYARHLMTFYINRASLLYSPPP